MEPLSPPCLCYKNSASNGAKSVGIIGYFFLVLELVLTPVGATCLLHILG